MVHHSGEAEPLLDRVVATVLDVFGPNSLEYRQCSGLSLWSWVAVGMPHGEQMASLREGTDHAVAKLEGLVRRLEEKREDLVRTGPPRTAVSLLGDIDLHPRIGPVAAGLFRDGHPWEAVFNASKALVNQVKERSGRYDLDGASLMHTVFSVNKPILVFGDLSTQTGKDEQQGMMHLFVGAVLGIRNPGGHDFPDGPPERALEYLQLLSLLAYRVEEAERVAQ